MVWQTVLVAFVLTLLSSRWVYVLTPDEAHVCTPVSLLYRETTSLPQVHQCAECQKPWPHACCFNATLNPKALDSRLAISATFIVDNATSSLQTMDIDCGLDPECQQHFRQTLRVGKSLTCYEDKGIPKFEPSEVSGWLIAVMVWLTLLVFAVCCGWAWLMKDLWDTYQRHRCLLHYIPQSDTETLPADIEVQTLR